MKRQYVSNITVPMSKRRNKLQVELDEFMACPETTMILTWEPGDCYKASHSMYASYAIAVKRSGYPIKVCKRGVSVYLTKEI